jgi:superfamily I DNA/RNA helicase
MPTLEDVKTALTKTENGSELIELVSGLALKASEADSHKTGLSTLHSTHNKVINELKALGYQGGEINSFISELKSKVEKVSEYETRANQAGAKLTEEQRRLLDLEKKLSSLSEQAEKDKNSLRSRKLKDAVLPKLKDRIFGADLRAEKLIADGLVTELDDGRLIYRKGTDEFDLEKGLEEYLKLPENIDDLKNNQNAGAGTGAMRGGVQGKVMTRAVFESLDATKQHAYIKDGGRII